MINRGNITTNLMDYSSNSTLNNPKKLFENYLINGNSFCDYYMMVQNNLTIQSC